MGAHVFQQRARPPDILMQREVAHGTQTHGQAVDEHPGHVGRFHQRTAVHGNAQRHILTAAIFGQCDSQRRRQDGVGRDAKATGRPLHLRKGQGARARGIGEGQRLRPHGAGGHVVFRQATGEHTAEERRVRHGFPRLAHGKIQIIRPDGLCLLWRKIAGIGIPQGFQQRADA